ncbi:MAG: hypothetical protein NZ992_07890 [Candidatus Korarchaeum sp.]|nr:hypothetical protein [Candidatus Korarchaeum sp.]MDW8035123.1 hypothetical protein [Candidatus Korarchaeum sp.]
MNVGKTLHNAYFRLWNLRAEDIKSKPLTPTNMGYLNHLWRSALLEEFPVSLAALTPCYWIYLEVGRYLEDKGSPNELYSRWISTYSSGKYSKVRREDPEHSQ